jgi:hypothetical protein
MYSQIIRDNVHLWNRVAFYHFSIAYAVVTFLCSVGNTFDSSQRRSLHYTALLLIYYTYGFELHHTVSLISSIIHYSTLDSPVPAQTLSSVAEAALFDIYVLSVSSALWCIVSWTTGFEIVGLIGTGVLVQLTSMTLEWIPSNASAACTQLSAATTEKVIDTLLHVAQQLLTRLADLTRYPQTMRLCRKTYRYQPLTSSDIRLLKIVRRLPFTPLQCELVHVDMHSSTLYDVISYT